MSMASGKKLALMNKERINNPFCQRRCVFVFHFSIQVSLSVSAPQIRYSVNLWQFIPGQNHIWEFENLYHSFKEIGESVIAYFCVCVLSRKIDPNLPYPMSIHLSEVQLSPSRCSGQNFRSHLTSFLLYLTFNPRAKSIGSAFKINADNNKKN